MFLWLSDDDALSVSDLDPNQTYDALRAQATSVEPHLRRRGGLVYRSGEDHTIGLPPILAAIEEDYDLVDTFAPGVAGRQRRQPRQSALQSAPGRRRSTIGASSGSGARAALLDVDDYNRSQGSATDSAIKMYNKRQLMTLFSTSDDISRKIIADDPAWTNATGVGVYDGQLKFYLGDVAKAFRADGTFRNPSSDPNTAKLIVGCRAITTTCSADTMVGRLRPPM